MPSSASPPRVTSVVVACSGSSAVRRTRAGARRPADPSAEPTRPPRTTATPPSPASPSSRTTASRRSRTDCYADTTPAELRAHRYATPSPATAWCSSQDGARPAMHPPARRRRRRHQAAPSGSAVSSHAARSGAWHRPAPVAGEPVGDAWGRGERRRRCERRPAWTTTTATTTTVSGGRGERSRSTTAARPAQERHRRRLLPGRRHPDGPEPRGLDDAGDPADDRAQQPAPRS